MPFDQLIVPGSIVLMFVIFAAMGLYFRRTLPRPRRLVLTWSDEFDGAAGSAPDPTKWVYDIGGSGWGNSELQCYTDRRENSYLDGKGNLVIKAIKEKEPFAGPDGIKCDYTSARLKTKGLFEQQYGVFEACIKLPSGQGLWPAHWMLGNNISGVGWPMCGEVDNMENKGKEPGTNYGSLHGPGYAGANALTTTITLPDGKKLSDDFHVYKVEWEESEVRFYVDDVHYATKSRADVGTNPWVFDHPFFLLLNVAVGGHFGGNPDDTTVFPQEMLVAYVRAYKWVD